MTGGFSPARVFGPVRGTSAGTVGWVACGGPEKVEEWVGELEAVLAVVTGVVLGAAVLAGGLDVTGVLGAGPLEVDVQAAAHATAHAAANAAIVRIAVTI